MEKSSQAEASNRVVIAALVGNLAIALSKFVAAVLTGSSAMLAEAIHSTTDTGNQLLLLIGRKRSMRPPDREHPFGYGRELYFWAFIVAMSVFAVGGGLSIYEGVRHVIQPAPLEDPTWNYVVLAVAAVFELGSWLVAWRELKRFRLPGEGTWHAIKRSKDPSIYTVFVEDTAALAGIGVAFLGIFLSHLFQIPQLDGAASIVIGLILVMAAVALCVETGGLLIGESATPEELEDMRRTIAGDPAVEHVGDVLTMQLSPEEVFLVADIGFRDGLQTDDLERAIDRIEESVRERHPTVHRIFFEAEAFSTTKRRMV